MKYLKQGSPNNYPPYASFKTQEQRAAALALSPLKNNGKLFGIFCPVDVTITDENGIPLASVINREVEYYNSNYGEIIIAVNGDKKAIYIQGDKQLYIHLIGTDEGEMEFVVQSFDCGAMKVLSEKRFENVSITEGKEMLSIVNETTEGDTDDVSKVPLYVVDPETEKPIKTVDKDGTETKIAYTVTFNPNGGTVTETELNTDENGKLTSLPTPTRENFTFNGWYTEIEKGEKITTDTVFTEDATVYAHWLENSTPTETEAPITEPTASDTTASEPISTETSTEISASTSPEISAEVSTEISSEVSNKVSTEASTPAATEAPATVPSESSDISGIITSDTEFVSSADDSNNSGSDNPPMGMSLAIIPVVLAAGTLITVLSKKKK